MTKTSTSILSNIFYALYFLKLNHRSWFNNKLSDSISGFYCISIITSIMKNNSDFISISCISICYRIGSLSYTSIDFYFLLFRLYHHLSVWGTRVRLIVSFTHLLVVEPS
nr:MAG TPA: hypothetical protein [Caudoviricetes sp.]